MYTIIKNEKKPNEKTLSSWGEMDTYINDLVALVFILDNNKKVLHLTSSYKSINIDDIHNFKRNYEKCKLRINIEQADKATLHFDEARLTEGIYLSCQGGILFVTNDNKSVYLQSRGHSIAEAYDMVVLRFAKTNNVTFEITN